MDPLINEVITKLKNIAEVARSKTGTTQKLTLEDIANEINKIIPYDKMNGGYYNGKVPVNPNAKKITIHNSTYQIIEEEKNDS